jgi:hypothetical protein
MLASQRAKEQHERDPIVTNKTSSRFTKYFPLGYKEGFSQWVSRYGTFSYSSAVPHEWTVLTW